MTLRLYNTLSRSAQEFVPLAPPVVTVYTCGPTVYNFAHIGNFRTFIFEDVLRRWLEASGFEVFHVMNLTDVDDKTIKGALQAGRLLDDHTAQFIAAFHEDREYLHILPAHEYPRATEFIAPMISLVESLLDKGVAYRGDDGSVYFAIARFPQYGRLSRLDTRELKGGASGRTSEDEYAKEDARDFVLWKAARPEDEQVGAAWDAPFGRGRPGWHLECSAMALDLIGKKYGATVLDIHAGGVDLIFPHHEDEIAQSCAHTGEEHFARYWMHGEFLTMGGTKMSKRFGNFLTARDLREDGVDAGTVRTLFATTHYRAPADFADTSLAAAREGSRRLGAFDARLRQAGNAAGESAQFSLAAIRLRDDFTLAMNDDLNTPRALSALFEAAREGNRLLDGGELPGTDFLSAWERATWVLQVLPSAIQGGAVTEASAGTADLPDQPPVEAEAALAWAQGWAARRLAARQDRDWAEADRIRDLLAAAGWQVRDSRDGAVVEMK